MKNEIYYVNGVGIVSPQVTFDNSEFLPNVHEYADNILTCVTPDVKNYITPAQSRRLSRLLRTGLSAAIICMRDAKNEAPDGIITATGYGLLEDTAKFLTEMLQREEKQLTPTYFMQSTYNSLGGLVALHTKCMGYNTTYVSKGFAFETALTDAMMQISERNDTNFLVGSYDEAGATQYAVNRKAGHYKSEKVNNLKLFESNTVGSLQGEGAAFFFISLSANDQTWCGLQDVRMIYKPEGDELAAAITDFLAVNSMKVQDIDVFISGVSGDIYHDRPIHRITEFFFSRTIQLRFKHLCGEYCTASSFAFWMGASVLKKQQLPSSALANTGVRKGPFKTVLIVNHYNGINYSLTLLRKV